MAHDWEALYDALATATATYSQEELVGLLRDLIREYVVERGLPTGTPAQAVGPDLATFDFPQLVRHLKESLSLPELGLFTVDGDRVLVEADGPRVLQAPALRSAPAPTPTPSAKPRPADRAPAASARPPEAAKPARPVSRRFKNLEFD